MYLSDVSMLHEEERTEMQNGESVEALLTINEAMVWLCGEAKAKYPYLTSFARNLLLPFPSSYLAVCGSHDNNNNNGYFYVLFLQRAHSPFK